MADKFPPTKIEEQDFTNSMILMPTVCSSKIISRQDTINDDSNNDDIQNSTCSKTMMVESKTICSDKQKSEPDINPSKNKDLRYNEESYNNDNNSLLRDNIGLENIDDFNDIVSLNDDIGLDDIDDLNDIALLSEDISLENIDDLNDIALLSEDISLENIDDLNDIALFSDDISLENIDTTLFSVDIDLENIDINNDPPTLSNNNGLENIDNHNISLLSGNKGFENIDDHNTRLLSGNKGLKNIDDHNDSPILKDDKNLENIDGLNNSVILSDDSDWEDIDDDDDPPICDNDKSLENIDDHNTPLLSGNKDLENIDDHNDPPILKDDKNFENIDGLNNSVILSDDSDWEDIDDDDDPPICDNDKSLENIDDHNTPLLSGNKDLENIDDHNDPPILKDDKNFENIDGLNNSVILSDDSDWEDIDDDDDPPICDNDKSLENIDDHNTPLLSGNKGLENIDGLNNSVILSDDSDWEDIDDDDDPPICDNDKSLENIYDLINTVLLSDNSNCEDIDKLSNNINNIPIDPILLMLNEEQKKIYSFMNSDLRIKSYIHVPSTFDNDTVVYDKNEIDEIIDGRFIIDKSFYLVKWKNWSRGFNTWESIGALYKSQEHIFNFKKKKQCTDKPINIMHLMLTRHIITQLFVLFRTVSGLSLPSTPLEDISSLINALDNDFENVKIVRKKCIRSYLSMLSLDFFRQTQFRELEQWKIDIYVISQNYVRVENNIDLEGPPDSFVYINNCIPQKGIILPNNPSFGCSCKKNCQFSNNCCSKLGGNVKAYDANKNIKVSVNYPIFECNKKCKCTSSCINRVVQLGSKVNVCIYKSRYPGWALRTYNDIKKGQFVGIYVGEIITVEECNQRIQNSSSSIDYTWKLDFNGPKTCKFFVDSTNYGNFTRFINHSCEANLSIHFVWINCLNRYFPQLALFANRKIFAGEQLTTDYFVHRSNDTMKKSGIKCHCEMKSCKGYYF